MQHPHLLTLFGGPTASGSKAPALLDDFIAFRRRFGEGVADASGPPGALARAVWGYFRCGGERALVVSTGQEPLTAGSPDTVAAVASALSAGLVRLVTPLVVLTGLATTADELMALAEAPVVWPDPSPLVLLDAWRALARDADELVATSRRLLQAAGGRFRLVTPAAVGGTPVQGPARPGAVSAAALAAGLVAQGGVARVAGSGLSLPALYGDDELRQLVEAGVMVLRSRRNHLQGFGLPRLPGPADGSGGALPTDASPFGPLLEHLREALAHHAHSLHGPGLYRQVERDATSALARFFGRGQRGFRARCDAELNPPERRDEGVLVVEVVLGPPLPLVREVVLRVSVRE